METKNTSNIKFFDYGKSFVITENHPTNTPRFSIEAKCTMDDQEYYLCAPCKGENTYAEESLFTIKPFEFTPIISKEEILLFRKYNFFNSEEKNEYKKAYIGNDIWGEKKFFIKEAKAKELLDSPEKINNAVKNGLPIMCRLVIKQNDKSATIDFPIKTINVHKDNWQVDTGVLPIPDLTGKYPYKIFAFNLAYVAFNSFDSVEFLIRNLFEIEKYFIISPCETLKIKDPEIYLYSL